MEGQTSSDEEGAQEDFSVNRPLRVLFICAMNRERSPTAETLYRNDARLQVRSAGVRSDAKRRVSEEDMRWADVVFVMEREHQARLRSLFGSAGLPPIEVLDIPDEYGFMDPRLHEILRLTIDPEIEAILGTAEG